MAQGVSPERYKGGRFSRLLQWLHGCEALGSQPYLRNPAMRERIVVKSVATSSAIEGIRAPFKRKPGGLYAISVRITRKKA